MLNNIDKTLKTELWFGKHKGITIKKCIKNDVQYIRWCLESNIFTLDQEAKKMYDKSIRDYESKPHYKVCYSEDEMDELAFDMGLCGGGQGW